MDKLVPTSVILNFSRPNTNQLKGREAELTVLKQWLDDASIRLITIAAAGGYGKSTLASKLYEQASGFDDQFWVYFDQPYRFGQWGRWILAQLGQEFDERLPDEQLRVALVNRLSQGRFLLVLDNLETVLKDKFQWQPYGLFLQALCDSSGDSQVLITSRIKPEGLPWLSEEMDLKGLSEQAALDFLETMKVQGTDADLRQFVTLTDCHPLLLKLTVEWLRKKRGKSANVAFILGQQDINLFRDIVGNHRDDPEVSIGKVLEQSLSLLPSSQQQLWQNLSVYRQSFELAQAKAMQPKATEENLRELARYALLQEEPTEESWKFSFLPLLQGFAQERAGEQSEAHRQAIMYFSSISQPEVWQTIEDITPFLEKFYHHCKLKQFTEALITIGSPHNYDKSIEKFLDFRSYNRLRIELYSQLSYEWKPESGEEKALYCSVLNRLGAAYYFLSEYEQAVVIHQNALLLAQEICDRNAEGHAFSKLSNVYYSLGNYQQAIECDQQFLKIAQEIGSRVNEAYALGGLGNSYYALGAYEKAFEYYENRLTISKSINDPRNQSYALCGLGNSYYVLERYQQAIEAHKECLSISREIGDRRSESYALAGLGNAYHALNNYEKAIQFNQSWLEISREIGRREDEGNALINIGDIYFALGEIDISKAMYEESLVVGNSIKNCRIIANSLNGLGEISNSLDEHLRALELYRQALKAYQHTNHPQGKARIWFNLGDTLFEIQEIINSIDAYTNARELFKSIGLEGKVTECNVVIERIMKDVRMNE